MTSAEAVIIIPLWTVAAVTIIKTIADAFRHQKQDQKADVAHGVLVAGTAQVASALAEVKVQTNGNTTALQAALASSLIEIGRLQGMVQGLQALRSGSRATDLAALAAPVAPGTSGDAVRYEGR